MRTLLRHSAIYLIARGVPGAINFLAIAIYTRLLSPQEYGQYVLVIAAVGFTSVLCFQWINLSLLRFVPSSEFAISDLLSTVKATYWAIVGFTALVGTTGILVLAPGDQRWLMLIALPLLWLQAWFDMNLELARARLQPARYGIAAGLRAVSAITLGTALVTLKLGAFAPLLGLATGYVLGGMTLQALGWKTCRVRLVTPVLKQLLRYGLPLAATLALSYVISSSDRFLIAYHLGEQEAGIYAASYDMVSQFLVMLMMIINMAAYPLVITALEQSGAEAARVQLARNLWLLLAASVPATLGMVLFAPQIASLVLGKSFRQAGTVIIPWIAAATLLAGVRSYYFDLAFQLGKQTIGQLWVVGSSAVVNFVLNMVLIPRTGMLGAAWATIAAYAVALLLSVLLGRRAFTVPLNWRGAGQVLLAAAAMVACWYLLPSGETLWSVAGQITCVVLIYCTTLFLLHTHWRHRFPFAIGGRRE